MTAPAKNFRTTVQMMALGALLSLLYGCVTSTIVPLRGTEQVEEWVPADEVAATAPATMTAAIESAPATMAATAPTSEPAMAATPPASPPTTIAGTEPAPAMAAATSTAPAATQPLVRRIREVDHDQTARYVYRANYKRVWEQGQILLTGMGYRIDRQDYRLGVLTTFARPSVDILEVWRPDQVGPASAAENTVNRQQRTLRLTIKPVEGKPAFFEIAVQVLVERLSNPMENLGGESFITGSGFGRTPVSLRSDYTPGPQEEPGPAESPRWRIIGHDVKLEKKVLDQLFEHI